MDAEEQPDDLAEFQKRFGATLKEERNIRGWPSTEVAVRGSLAPRTYTNIENGRAVRDQSLDGVDAAFDLPAGTARRALEERSIEAVVEALRQSRESRPATELTATSSLGGSNVESSEIAPIPGTVHITPASPAFRDEIDHLLSFDTATIRALSGVLAPLLQQRQVDEARAELAKIDAEIEEVQVAAEQSDGAAAKYLAGRTEQLRRDRDGVLKRMHIEVRQLFRAPDGTPTEQTATLDRRDWLDGIGFRA